MFNQIRFSFLPIAIVVLLLWLPFGFEMTGLVEEWGILGRFTTSSLFFVINPFMPEHLAAHYLRPLTILPHALAYSIDSDSFNVWHVFTMLTLLIKGIACSYFGWILTRSRNWSLLLGILVVVYPADTMQISFRSIHINVAEILLLAAAAIHLATYEITTAFKRYFFAFLSCLLFTAAILMYEASLPMFFIVFLIAYAKFGWRTGWQKIRNNRIALFTWCLAPALYLLYVGCITLLHPPTVAYQATIANDGWKFFLDHHLPLLFRVGVFRALIGGWYDAAVITLTEFKYYTYLIFVLLCGICYWLICRNSLASTQNDTSSQSSNFRIFIAGMALLILGYMPFLASYAHILITQRTYLLATPGAALVILALLRSMAKISKWFAIGCSIFLMLIAFAAQLNQFKYYVNFSVIQQKILKGVMENFDGNIKGKTLLILDGSNSLGYTWLLYQNLSPTLSYLYDERIPDEAIEVCLTPENVQLRTDASGKRGNCTEYKDKWILKNPPLSSKEKSVIIPKNKLIVVRINPDYSAELNPGLNAYRARLQSGQDHAAKRYRNILANHSWPYTFDQFISARSLPYYHLSFGKWWSLDTPIQGVGWNETEWAVGFLHHPSMQWKTQKKATMLVEFSPLANKYILHGQFSMILGDKIKDSLRISLNKYPLAITWQEDRKFTAMIPAGILLPSRNKLEFDSLTDPTNGDLSLQLGWLELTPVVMTS